MSVFANVGERLNPILVKEVRQALRGRFFAWIFWLTLLLAAGVSFISLGKANIENDTAIGLQLFSAVFVCLSIAIHGFVPFTAFQSIGSEWEENTIDLLLLSNLTPSQIVRGKILSSLIQTLLLYSAFVPFLALAFLFGGIDLLAAFVVLAMALLYSFVLITVSVGLSTLAKTRLWRYLLAFVVAIALIAATSAGSAFLTFMVRSGTSLRSSEMWQGLFLAIISGLVIAFMFCSAARARLSHAEENTATPFRIFSTVTTIVWVIVTERVYVWDRYDDDAIIGMTAGACMFHYIISLFSTTEAARLTRRAADRIPLKPRWMWLSIPFQPGSGRAVIHLILNLTILFVGVFFIIFIHGALATTKKPDPEPLIAMLTYTFILTALPSLIFSRMCESRRYRAVARILVFIILLGMIILPMMFGALVGSRKLMEGEHFLNPFWVVSKLDGAGDHQLAALVLVSIAFFIFIANGPRMYAGIREVLQAGVARRGRMSIITENAIENVPSQP
ncbi:MAG: ABC transporter permease [Planctomycetota bacterium]